MAQVPPRAFVSRYKGLSRVLANECGIGTPLDPDDPDAKPPEPIFYRAIWDTGATGTVITERVATECGLQPIGVAHSYTASGEEIVDVFLVSVFLPNGLAIDRVRVTKHLLQGADILIGMDIIALGDFAVTNHNGKTTFSYRYPSMQEIDYVKEVEKENLKNAKKKRTGKTKRGGKRRRAW